MKNPYILMVENDEDDQYITQDYFAAYPIPLKILGRSDELFLELSRSAGHGDPLPALILLSYFAGPIGTRETLLKLKRDPALSHIPVVVLCGTKDDVMVRDCYSWGASSFIRKPALVEETNTKIGNFLAYWFDTVELA